MQDNRGRGGQEEREKEASSVSRKKAARGREYFMGSHEHSERERREDETMKQVKERHEGGREVCTIGESRVKFIHLTKSSSLPVC